MDYFTIYLTVVLALVVLFAIRTPDTDAKFLFRAVLVWPFSVTVILFVLFWDALGWTIDVFPNKEKRFGFRWPSTNKVRGFAVTVFGNEYQVYKERI